MGAGQNTNAVGFKALSLRLVFRRAAQRELDQAAQWYEFQRPRLGVEFVAEIQQVLESLSANPQQFPIADGDVRGALVPRFPFCIYFRVKPHQVVIIAVFHSSRESTIWRSRT